MLFEKNNWNEISLGEAGKFIKGAPLSKSDITFDGTPVIFYGELYTTYNEVVYDVLSRTTREVKSIFKSTKGDVLIPSSGETAEEISTSTCVMADGVILAGDLFIYRSKILDGRYLSYTLNHLVNKDLTKIAQGSSIIHLRANELSKIHIPLPPLKEQQAIVEVLESFDEHIKNLDTLIAKKRDIRDGALRDLMSGRVRVDGFSGEWREGKLKDIASITRGASPRPIEKYLTLANDGINWIKIGDAPRNGKFICSTQEKITPEGASHSVRVQRGDFILSNSMSFGRPYVLQIEGCIHDGWLSISNFDNFLLSDFLYYTLLTSSIKEQFIALAAGSGVKNLKKEIVGKVVIQFPSLEEQQAIAEILTSMDDEIICLEAEKEKWEQIRDGAMDDLLSGKVRVSK